MAQPFTQEIPIPVLPKELLVEQINDEKHVLELQIQGISAYQRSMLMEAAAVWGQAHKDVFLCLLLMRGRLLEKEVTPVQLSNHWAEGWRC